MSTLFKNVGHSPDANAIRSNFIVGKLAQPKPAVKPAAKPPAIPTAKPAAKPAVKPAAKPAGKKAKL